jgi:hypothetical protein
VPVTKVERFCYRQNHSRTQMPPPLPKMVSPASKSHFHVVGHYDILMRLCKPPAI